MTRLLYADLSLSFYPNQPEHRPPWCGYRHKPGLGRYVWLRVGPFQLGLEFLLDGDPQ